MAQRALTSQPHWDGLYRQEPGEQISWRPRSYNQRIIARALAACVRLSHPASILEVGCGDSLWLPWLAALSTATITGLDYSPRGCRLVERRLDQVGRPHRVICADLFSVPDEVVGRHDFAYSLGLIEHFTDLDHVIGRLKCLVAPGGRLLSVVPNLASIHGEMTRIWQPHHHRGHRRLTMAEVRNAYNLLCLIDVEAWYLGTFSLDIPAWETAPRWPRAARVIIPMVRFANAACDRLLIALNSDCGTSGLSPFFCVLGRVPHSHQPAAAPASRPSVAADGPNSRLDSIHAET